MAAQGLEARRDGDEPVWRTPPTLSDVAVGDQVAVTGHDLLAALADVGPRTRCGCPAAGGRPGRSSPRRPTCSPATRRLL